MDRIIEPTRMGEQVTRIVRREPNMKPSDTQCRADLGEFEYDKETGEFRVEDHTEERCEKEIAYDEKGDSWTDFCRDHLTQDNKAREDGEPRVAKIARVEGSSESVDALVAPEG